MSTYSANHPNTLMLLIVRMFKADHRNKV